MQTLVLLLAVMLIAIRLPSVMDRLELKGGTKIAFVLMVFAVLGIAWLTVESFGMVPWIF